MKIYIITKGEYSDYHICAVTTDKKQAVLLKQRYNRNDCFSFGDAKIEIFDTEQSKEILRYENTYFCRCEKNSSNIIVSSSSPEYAEYKVRKIKDGSLYVYVNADTEEDAIKFASDKFSKYKAEKVGL